GGAGGGRVVGGAGGAGGGGGEQGDHVAPIRVEAQRAARPRLGARGAAENRVAPLLLHLAIEAVLVAHLADELAVGVLIAGVAQMGAHAPGEVAQLVEGIAVHIEAAQHHDAATVLQLLEDGGEVAREGRHGEVLAPETRPGESATRETAHGSVDLLRGARRHGHDPLRGPGHVVAQPGFGTLRRLRTQRAHRDSFPSRPRNSRTMRRNSSRRSWCNQCPAFSSPTTVAWRNGSARPSSAGFPDWLSVPYRSSVGQSICDHRVAMSRPDMSEGGQRGTELSDFQL